MALTLSAMIPLGTEAPPFQLLDVRSEKIVSLQTLKSDQATVVMFICNHCPFVKHLQKKIAEVAKNYQAKGIAFIAISSNDIRVKPDDAPEKMRLEAEKFDYMFPYLYDETQAVAKAYQATCTPDFYVFDRSLKCVYRGRFDEATPGNETPVTGKELCAALDQVLKGKPVNADQKPSMGCNIKWK